LLARLGNGVVIGREIEIFQETTSTSDLVARMAQAGAPEGVAIFAEAQSKGRGRLGRLWVSPPGKGLWFSVLLRPAFRPEAATQLTIAASVALARAVRLLSGVSTEIKWPNDILLGGKKVAGILTEISGEVDRVNYAVLGMGINVNQKPEELPEGLAETMTSLSIATGREVPRMDLAVAALLELERVYKLLGPGEFTVVAGEWQELCSTVGKVISVRQGARVITGVAQGVDADGALLIRSEQGVVVAAAGGDLTLLK
jgi:BirA family biotin operon repressor/biotin-[acetyl-CoA-carboxylase] ligase